MKLHRFSLIMRVLSVLLALQLSAVFVIPVFAYSGGSDISISKPDTAVNAPFEVDNMFPGDSVTKDFDVRVSHSNPVEVYFHADIRPGYEKLSEVMMFRIELPDYGVTLYDGLMRDMPSAVMHTIYSEKHILYRMTAYLDTSVGNDYQFKELVADFRWWFVEYSDYLSTKITAEKTMDGLYARGSDFAFELLDENGNVVLTGKNEDGYVNMPYLRFHQDGTYIYYFREVTGNDENIIYDQTVYRVEITVISGGSPTYIVTTKYFKDDVQIKWTPRFVNVTAEKGEEVDNPIEANDLDVLPDDPYTSIPSNSKSGGGESPNFGILLVIPAALLVILLLVNKSGRKDNKEGRDVQ